jgi:hypothetical protein
LGRVTKWARVVGQEGRLVVLPADRTTVFVGDTHGDRDATERVLDRFPPAANALVFLGDYVDRGPDSLGNLTLLLEAKLSYPDQVFLLMGNHEAWAVTPFSPADFWDAMPREDEERHGDMLSALPFAAWHPAGILALHGALPDVARIEDIARIELGSADWQKITWGDWADLPGYGLGSPAGRPTFGADYFEEVATRLGIKVLVRAHQPTAPTFLYGDRCLTVFTSQSYGGTVRQVAVFRPGRPLRSARDLDLVRI